MKPNEPRGAPPRVLTLRFRNLRTYQRLKQVAALVGTSMNEIAEAAVERELDFLSADLESQLTETVEALKSWRSTEADIERDIQQFGDAESSLRDPMRATLRTIKLVDPLNIGALFADSVEH
ncbi:MAG: hypothetical protein IIC71_14050 [Acidobacteria bacterium]|nr:hypothetical protein [Acidobacteriota bacterium]